jgi:hypothetical protein
MHEEGQDSPRSCEQAAVLRQLTGDRTGCDSDEIPGGTRSARFGKVAPDRWAGTERSRMTGGPTQSVSVCFRGSGRVG